MNSAELAQTSMSNAPSSSTPARDTLDGALPARSTRAGRPASASSDRHSSRNAAEAAALEPRQHTQKLFQECRGESVARRWAPDTPRASGGGPSAPDPLARLSVGQTRLSPTPTTTCAVPPLLLVSTSTPPIFRSSNQMSFGHFRRMPRAPRPPSARRDGYAHGQAQGRYVVRRAEKCPPHRQCEARAERRDPAPPLPSPARRLQLRERRVREAAAGGAAARAAGYWSSPPRTAPPDGAAGPTASGAGPHGCASASRSSSGAARAESLWR